MKEYEYRLPFDLNDQLRITNCNDCPVGKYDDMENEECCNMFGCETSDCQVPKECKLIEVEL